MSDNGDLSQGLLPTAELLFKFADVSLSGLRRVPKAPAIADRPLIIAIHGGTYNCRYFDIAGYSLLERATTQGIPILALDRPGYGRSTPLPPSEANIIRNAEQLDSAIGQIWRQDELGARGVVLVGHSIGAAVTVTIASRLPKWPLLGIAISGVGLTSPPEAGQAWSSLPDLPMIELPPELKDGVMFGPHWTYDAAMPEASHAADAPVPRAELISIVTDWPAMVHTLAAQVAVPVHYRQGEFDKLWITGPSEVAAFGASLSAAPYVDARLFESAGHCIDFHRCGAAFQLEQLAFARRCAVTAK